MAPQYQVRVASRHQCQMGQSPHWDSRKEALYYVDRNAGCVACLDVETKQDLAVTHLEGMVAFAIPITTHHNRVATGHKHFIRIVDMKRHHSTEIIGLVEAENAATCMNVGKCDATGRLWTATAAIENRPLAVQNGLGALYSVNNKMVKQHAVGLTMPSGLGWSTDSRTMFLVDSLPHGKIFAFNHDLNLGDIFQQRIVLDFHQDNLLQLGHPSGMAVDQHNKLWVACANGAVVVRIDPTVGKIVDKIDLPTDIVTSVCFGGPDLSTLYVTSGFLGLTSDQIKQQPTSGAIFEIIGIPTKGQPSYNINA